MNGRVVAFEDANVSVMSHAMQRGSLVFDITTFHATARGTMLFRVREHVARFVRSAELIGLALPFDASALERAAHEAVRASKLDAGLLRWSAFFPSMEADIVPRDPTASVAVAAYASSDALPPGLAPKPRPERWRVAIFEDARKAGPEVFPPEAKVAASYLGPMLARRRAVLAGADEVVLLDREGHIAEAPTANVLAVRAGTLVAPALGRILHGITRDSVLAVARAEGIAARDEAMTLAAFEAADEAMLVSSSLAVASIGAINGRELPREAPVTARLRARFEAIQRGEDARFAEWLTPLA
jgi:branched-chain amino acid aminotransferase